jgi:glycosyltransferase involved in cell wall biosynthesis
VPEASPAAQQAFADRWGLAEDQPVVVVVARMDPIKGQDRVLRALPTVLRKVPGARVLLVGNGSFTSSGRGLGHPKGRRWREHLEAVVKEEGLEKAVTFTGYLPPEELDAAWRRADVVAVPSTREGFGTTAVEAWMRGKPVVLSRGAGASELVVEGVNGLTHEPEDVPALAEHLSRVLADRALAERLGERGQELAQVCGLAKGAQAEDAILRETIQRFHERPRT